MKTFTSKHYQINESDVTGYLSSKGYEYRPVSGGQFNVKTCPTCPDTKGNSQNYWRLYINRSNGAFMCHRCNEKGSFWDFKKVHGDLKAEFTNYKDESATSRKTYTKPDQKRVNALGGSLERYPAIVEYFAKRNITKATLERFGVGGIEYKFPHAEIDGEWVSELCMTFPWKNPKTKEIVRIKGRSIVNKRNMRLDPSGGAWGWFGLDLVPDDCKEVVMTEGEIDTISGWQETGVPFISLPNGARSLPPELIEQLERFDSIIFWLDDDQEGQAAAEKFAEKLGRGRCKNILSRRGEEKGPKDANEALMMGLDLKEILVTAENFPHEQIVTATDLKDAIFREIVDPKATDGTPWDSIPGLVRILKGHRDSEFTVLTGLPGTGKTTILSQMSLDIAKRGRTSLWGSFEIKNTKLAKNMIYQNSGVALHKYPQDFERHFANFEKIPFYFMRYFGSTKTKDILDVMEYAVYALDVKSFYLDNLQFMTSGQGGHGSGKFAVQDEAIFEMRNFANKRNVHITTVIHVGKSEDFGEIDPSNISGTAKAYQECDNMILIQKTREYRYLDVRKNRHDGDLGRIPYEYDKETKRIVELTEQEAEMLKSGVPAETVAGTAKKRSLPNFAPTGAKPNGAWWNE